MVFDEKNRPSLVLLLCTSESLVLVCELEALEPVIRGLQVSLCVRVGCPVAPVREVTPLRYRVDVSLPL